METRNQKLTGRGGPGRGQGRKRDVSKDLATGTATALKILSELKHEDELKKLYKECGDARLKAHIIFRLREWAYGKPLTLQKDEITFDPTQPLKVIVEHITGRSVKNPVATKAK